MGFIGHAAVGTLFSSYALVWMVNYAFQQAPSGRARKRYETSSSCARAVSRLPLGGMLILLSCISIFIGENMYPNPKWRIVDSDGNWVDYPDVWQHCTMAAFFGMHAVVIILARTCHPAAAQYEMLFQALAFGVEGYLLLYHSPDAFAYDQSGSLSLRCHHLLAVAAFGCSVTALTEVFCADRRIPLMRVVCIMVQGTWTWQLCFTLYPLSGTPWEDTARDQMFATVFLYWHVFVDIIALYLVYLIALLVGRLRTSEVQRSLNRKDDKSSLMGLGDVTEAIEDTTPFIEK